MMAEHELSGQYDAIVGITIDGKKNITPEIERLETEHATLKRLLQKAEKVQEGKVGYPHTFCWWCGGLKHDMTKIAATYCEGAALLAQEQEKGDENECKS